MCGAVWGPVLEVILEGLDERLGPVSREGVFPRCGLRHWSGVFPSLFMVQSARWGADGSVFSSPDPPPALSCSRASWGPDGLAIRAPWPVKSRTFGVEGSSGTFSTRIARARSHLGIGLGWLSSSVFWMPSAGKSTRWSQIPLS